MEFPQTNRALRFAGIGGPLEVTETEVPPLPANELLIKVHAASINPCDIQLWRSGLVGVVAGDKGMGKDYSGTIVAVGTSVKGFKEGDEVFGLLFHVFGQGTFSEYVNVNPSADPIAKKPSCFTHEQAASVPLVALTAYACLAYLPSQSSSERRVIIRGASGVLGRGLCNKLGTDEVIDYTRQDIAPSLLSRLTAAGQYDLLVDCVGGTDLIPAYPNLLHKTGAYVTIVGDKTDVRTLDGPITYLTCPSQVIRFLKGYFLGPRYACISFLTQSSYLEQIASLAERGEVKAEVQEVIEGAFDEREGWKRAVECMEGSHVRGKVVLAIP